MTVDRLRELLEDRVSDVESGDLSARAWQRAETVRRRRRGAAIGAAAAAVVVVAGGTVVLDDRVDTDPSPTGRPSTTATVSGGPSTSPSAGAEPTADAPRAELAGEFRGAPFWWAPPAEADAQLPVLQVPGLPDVLSMADEDPITSPPARVDAVFGTARQRYRLLSDGQMVSVDLSDRLGPVADEGGNAFSPLGAQSVSPAGTQVAFRQPGRVEVWDLPTNTWRTVSTPFYEQVAWTRDGELWLPGDGDTGRPDPWTEDHQYSQVVVGPGGAAEADWLGLVEVPGAREPGHYANPEILVAGPVGDPSVLAVGVDGRNKLCCALAGWFSHDFVLFGVWSPDGTSRLLAWRAGTPDLYRVSQYADIPRRFVQASWAEDAFTGFGS